MSRYFFTNMLNSWNQWDDYVVITWIIGKPMANLRGTHTLAFSDRTDEVCALLDSICFNNNKVNALCKAMKIFCTLCKVLSLVLLMIMKL